MDMAILLVGAGIVLIALLVALIAASIYFYNVAIKRNKKDFLKDSEDLEQLHKKQPQGDAQPTPVLDGQWVRRQDYQTWKMQSHDGLGLVAYYVPASQPTKKTAILAHGYSSKGMDMGAFAKLYHEQLGYNVLMPDDRGHGQSQGDYIGFGWMDRKDYLQWIQRVLERDGEEAQIVLHGISMGGATVMMLSGEASLPRQVKAIVEDCGYTSVKDQLAYQLKRMYRLPSFPIIPATSLLTKIKAGYSFDQASALKQLRYNHTPMLFIHGEKDTFVPTDMVWQLYHACKAQKDILIVQDAGHGMAYSVDPQGYRDKVVGFVRRYMG